MARQTGVVLFSLGLAASSAVWAQAPSQPGQLPLLAKLPQEGGRCSTANPTDDLRALGVVRMIMFQGGTPQRLIGVGADADNRPRSLLIVSSASANGRRREGESLQAFLDAEGRVTRGWRRHFTSGSLSRRSDDRDHGLLARDSAQVTPLARAVIAHCKG
jgi:hypothetical protein